MRIPGLEWLKSNRSPQPRDWDDEPVIEPQPTRRLRIVARLAFLWAFLLALRLVQIQIVRHDEFRRQAQMQQEKIVEVQAPRGTILDRNGRPLAMSLPVDSVCVNPQRIPDLNVAADVLSSVLELDRAQLLYKLQIYRDVQKGFLWVKRKITPEESARLRSYGVPWVEFRSESHRFYPKGELAAHVVGSVDYSERGVVGLEAGYEEELEGRPGTMRVVSDSRQRQIDGVVSTEPVAGVTIVSTIDERIQFVAERELRKAVLDNNCKTGSIVVMDPHTGEILAMASFPTFNPNEQPRPGEDLAPRLNLAVSAPFEPGSVFKVFTLSAALETTDLRPDSIINCGNGVINLFGRVIHDHDSYSSLTMQNVLAKSSNIGAIQVGLKVGEENLYDYVRRFGFGKDSGLDLPAESPGMLRKLKHWEPASIGSVAMGHEISTTTLQLARACAVIANGGFLVRPKVTKKSQRAGAQIEIVNAEKPAKALEPGTVMTMRQMMEAVVMPGGTGTRARLPGYTAGGKTGSAQIFDFENKVYTHKYNASFMGFAPLNNPAVVVVVTLNGASRYGGAVAAPVFKEVAGTALRILDVPRNIPEGAAHQEKAKDVEAEPASDLAIAGLGQPPAAPPVTGIPTAPAQPEAETAVAVNGARVPNFQGKTMRSVLETASSIGLPVEYHGVGIARSQSPPPGAMLPPGETVKIQFNR